MIIHQRLEVPAILDRELHVRGEFCTVDLTTVHALFMLCTMFGDNYLELGIRHLAPLNLEWLLIPNMPLPSVLRFYLDSLPIPVCGIYALSARRVVSLFSSVDSGVSGIRPWTEVDTAVPTIPIQSRLKLGYQGFQLHDLLGELGDYPVLQFYDVDSAAGLVLHKSRISSRLTAIYVYWRTLRILICRFGSTRVFTIS